MHAQHVMQQKRHINSRSTVGTHSKLNYQRSRIVPNYASQVDQIRDLGDNKTTVRAKAQQYYTEHNQAQNAYKVT